MKNIALIIAGGIGARTHQDIPKQFIHVHDVPVIVYTMQAFEKHPEIDAIEVVCLEGWDNVVWAYSKQFLNWRILLLVVRLGRTQSEMA